MAVLVVFEGLPALERAAAALGTSESCLGILDVPPFCRGLGAPALIMAGGADRAAQELSSLDIPYIGILPHLPFKKEIPEAPPPDPRWGEILGALRIVSFSPSVSDPTRFRVEISTSADLSDLIPVLARLIRGGTFRPEVPVLAFEEEHRLIVLTARGMVISRVDDLLDLWTMLRCAVELTSAAWDRRGSLAPEREPRQGIGAIEIFKRLPGANCGKCGFGGCMEFAMCILTGRCGIGQCRCLMDPSASACRRSVEWLLEIIGVTDWYSDDPRRGGHSAVGVRALPGRVRKPGPDRASV